MLGKEKDISIEIDCPQSCGRFCNPGEVARAAVVRQIEDISQTTPIEVAQAVEVNAQFRCEGPYQDLSESTLKTRCGMKIISLTFYGNDSVDPLAAYEYTPITNTRQA